MKLRSSDILEEKYTNSAQRCLFKALGYTDFELHDRPLIGIANSWNTACPGHANLRELAEYVKKGIYSSGGTALEFGVIGLCDGIVDGDPAKAYTLPSREVICDSIEIQARASKVDALVLLGSCDKIIPGMLMAAARLDIPAILLNGGPMLGGIEFDGKNSDQTSIDEAIGMCQIGKVTKADVRALEDLACPSVGSCSFLGTANTMACVSEAIGMSLTGSALIPAVYSARKRAAFETGFAVCELVRAGISTRKIITEQAVRNAIAAVMTMSGSTNAVIHITAIAHEAGLRMDVVQTFREMYETTPQIARVNPAARWDMEDFYKAGGVPRVMKNLGNIVDADALTCTGKTLGENLESYVFRYPENPDVIRTPDTAFEPKGGIAILKGNLAPGTAVTKPGAFDPSLYRFVGRARVFDSEIEANQAILGGEIRDGDVIVIRYEGPKGGPGMQEMYRPMKYLYGMGKAVSTALITDGRFSGTNNGCFVGHISPEAADGGPIALVEDGDEILIDVNRGLLELHVSDEVLKMRAGKWKRPQKEIQPGFLRLYAKAASSAGTGAVMDYDKL